MVGMPPAPLGPIARSRWSGRVPYAAPGVLGPAPALRPRGGRYGTQGDGLSMATAAEVAAWMHAEFERTGELAQADAVAGIRARFGEAFVADGRIRNDVLAAFRRLAPEGRGWGRHAPGGRRREGYDPPPGGGGGGAPRGPGGGGGGMPGPRPGGGGWGERPAGAGRGERGRRCAPVVAGVALVAGGRCGMTGETSGAAFALRGGNWAILAADALVVARVEMQRVPYADIRDAIAAAPEPGGRGFDILCLTTLGPRALSFPDRETRGRFLVALRARIRQAQRDDA